MMPEIPPESVKGLHAEILQFGVVLAKQLQSLRHG